MGFFSAFFGMGYYEKTLRLYGVEPRHLSANLNARVCSYAEQQYKENLTIFGSHYRKTTPTAEAQLSITAALVAFCVLGPRVFLNHQFDNGLTLGRFKDAAADWKKSGPEATLDTMIIKTVSDEGFLHIETANLFNGML